jgi:hypothetical protein
MYPFALLVSSAALFSTPASFGQGFPTTATSWALPAGGQRSQATRLGFHALANATGAASEQAGSQYWTTQDMNGDQRPDLVVTSELQNGDFYPYGTAGARSWRVFLNTGAGYATIPTNWALPAGGRLGQGASTANSFYVAYSAGFGTEATGSQLWSLLDMNGDQKPDLVVTAEKNGSYAPFGPTTGPNWRVYLNSGSGPTATSTALVPTVTLHPNPATTQLCLTTTPSSRETAYTILNQLGQSLQTGRVAAATTFIDIQSLPAGVYCLQLHPPGAAARSLRFVKSQ